MLGQELNIRSLQQQELLHNRIRHRRPLKTYVPSIGQASQDHRRKLEPRHMELVQHTELEPVQHMVLEPNRIRIRIRRQLMKDEL